MSELWKGMGDKVLLYVTLKYIPKTQDLSTVYLPSLVITII